MASPFNLPPVDPFLAGLLDDFPPADRELLRRVATVRQFDSDIFEQVLCVDLPAEPPDAPRPPMSWAKLVSQTFVETLPGERPCYRIQESVRQAFLRSWTPQGAAPEVEAALREQLKRFSCRLVDYYAAAGAEADRLYHLAACDPAAATQLFSDLFDRALAGLDLAECHALVRLLRERAPYFDRTLADAIAVREGRLATHSRWERAMHETRDFVDRQHLAHLVEEGLIHGSTRVMQIVGPGGMGKSAFLRWCAVRLLLPLGIPVAYVDFSNPPHWALAFDPADLLLELARQLDDQLPGRPFRELLLQSESDGRSAGGDTSAGPASAFALRPTPDMNRQRFLERFSTLLAWSRPEGPIVLMFDSLDSLVYRGIDLSEFFHLLDHLTDWPGRGFDMVRILLASRIALADRWLSMARHDVVNVVMSPLATEDVRQYWAMRGLPDDERTAALVAASEGVPFRLKLLADMVIRQPSMRPEGIGPLLSADLAYLVTRVIERIPNPGLRWLIRYGVVPHRLTLDFVQHVIAPRLPHASSAASLDNPSLDDLPPEVLERSPFPQLTGEDQPPVWVLWHELVELAAEASWVQPAADQPDTLVFAPEVRQPMRYLLGHQKARGHDILLRLDLDAAQFFQAKAAVEEDPYLRGLWLAESVYHSVLAGDRQAGATWRRALAGAADPATRRALAEGVLRPPEQQFGEDEDAATPRWFGDDVRGLAHLELARLAAAEDPSLLTSGEEVERHLREAERLASERGVALPPDVLAEVRDAIARQQAAGQEAVRSPGRGPVSPSRA